MEEIIGLSKSKVEFEEIWKRFHCALFVVLLIYGLYYTAEKYERIISETGRSVESKDENRGSEWDRGLKGFRCGNVDLTGSSFRAGQI